MREHDVDIRTGVLSDQTIELTSARSRKAYPGTLRRVGYWDEETRRSYVFVTNNTTWVGKTIATCTSRGGKSSCFSSGQAKSEGEALRGPLEERGSVATVGGDVHVPAAGLPEVVLRLGWTLHRMLRVLQLNLFDRRPLVELFTTPSPPGAPNPQMLLWR